MAWFFTLKRSGTCIWLQNIQNSSQFIVMLVMNNYENCWSSSTYPVHIHSGHITYVWVISAFGPKKIKEDHETIRTRLTYLCIKSKNDQHEEEDDCPHRWDWKLSQRLGINHKRQTRTYISTKNIAIYHIIFCTVSSLIKHTLVQKTTYPASPPAFMTVFHSEGSL